jgi:hypothetical protein
MNAEREAGMKAWLAAGQAFSAARKGRDKCFQAITDDGHETLTPDRLAALVDKARALAVQNDPCAIDPDGAI